MDILALFNVGSNLMFSFGILFVLIFTIFYIRQRLSDYDNKINSMFQLVSKMANEIRNLKTPLPPIYENEELSDFKTDDLKVVSVTMNNEYDDFVEEEEEEVEEEEEEEEEDDTFDNEHNETDNNNTEDLEDKESFEEEEYEEQEQNVTELDHDSVSSTNLQKELEASIENDILEEEEQQEQQIENVRVVEFDNTLDSRVQDISIPNYKKLKFDELKSLVSTKGLSSEIQKMKKADLVHLLEEDFRKQHITATQEEEILV